MNFGKNFSLFHAKTQHRDCPVINDLTWLLPRHIDSLLLNHLESLLVATGTTLQGCCSQCRYTGKSRALPFGSALHHDRLIQRLHYLRSS